MYYRHIGSLVLVRCCCVGGEDGLSDLLWCLLSHSMRLPLVGWPWTWDLTSLEVYCSWAKISLKQNILHICSFLMSFICDMITYHRYWWIETCLVQSTLWFTTNKYLSMKWDLMVLRVQQPVITVIHLTIKAVLADIQA